MYPTALLSITINLLLIIECNVYYLTENTWEPLQTNKSLSRIGMYLTDLIYIEEGNKDFVPGTSLINFHKRRLMAHVITEIQQYQQLQYSFPVDENIRVSHATLYFLCVLIFLLALELPLCWFTCSLLKFFFFTGARRQKWDSATNSALMSGFNLELVLNYSPASWLSSF